MLLTKPCCMSSSKVSLKLKKLHLAADLHSVANGARFISDVYYTGDYRNLDEEK